MDSSSDGSFAWTDASDDTTDNETIAKTNMNTSLSGEESESGKTYKKKLQQRLFSGSMDDKGNGIDSHHHRKRKLTLQHSETENIKSPKKKRIKAEPESDVEQPKEKKKPHSSDNTRQNPSKLTNDESYLNLKVKNEQNVIVPSSVKIKKHKGNNISFGSDNCIINGDEDETNKSIKYFENQVEDNYNTYINLGDVSSQPEENSNFIEENEYKITKTKKKKKFKKIRKDSEGEDSVKKSIIKDSFCAEETKVEQRTECHQNQDSPEVLSNDTCSYVTDHNNDNMSRTNKKNAKKDAEDIPKDVSRGSRPQARPSSVPDITKRKSKISERIRFEDEYESDVLTNNTKTPIKTSDKNKNCKLKSFVEANINLKPFLTKLQSSVLVTEDDDVWIIRCPKDVKVEAFQDKKWSFESKCKIKLDGQTYEGSAYDVKRNMTVLSADHGNEVIKNLLINGCVRLRRRIPKALIQEDNIMVNNQNNFIPLPETKCRHPLFGFNYKKSIKLAAAVAERLRAPQNDTCSIVTEKRKKKKDKRNVKGYIDEVSTILKVEPVSEMCLSSEIPIEEITASKKMKKKKRKHSETADESSPPQHKRIKHNPESAEAWETEKAIEENLFNF